MHIIEDSIDQLKKKRILDNGIKNIVNSVALDDDEEESMLLRSIERSRKKVEIKSKPYNVLEAIKEEEQEEHEKEAKTVEIELNPIAYKSSEAVRKNHQVELKDAVGGTASVMYAKLPSERLAKKTVETEETPDKFGDFTKEEMLKMRE